MTWYYSICIFKWISSRCFSGILGSLAPLGLLLWPLQCFWLKRLKWPPVVISLTKNFIKLKSTFQQISSWFVKKFGSKVEIGGARVKNWFLTNLHFELTQRKPSSPPIKRIFWNFDFCNLICKNIWSFLPILFSLDIPVSNYGGKHFEKWLLHSVANRVKALVPN